MLHHRKPKRTFIEFVKDAVVYSPWYGRTLLMMAIFLVILKLFLIHAAYGAVLVTETFSGTLVNYVTILASDFMIVGVIFVGAFLNAMFRHRVLRWCINCGALLLMLLYVSDMFSIYYFQSRFYVLDLLQFFSVKNGASYVRYPFARAVIFVAILFVFFLLVQKLFPVIRRKNMHLRAALVFFGVCFLFSIVNFFSRTDFHFRNNVLAINIQEISSRLAGLGPLQGVKPYEQYFTPFAGQHRKGDLIVIFAESFSVVDSKRAGGIYDYLPGFDSIAADGVTFTNFIANGCTSDTSHIALLQGVEPREINQGSSDNYKNYKTYTDSLPVFFEQQGYETKFLSTAPLSFLHQRDFLSGLKFDTIIGEETFLSGPRYVFNTAPDEQLYARALNIVTTQPKDKPLLLAMQTISSHKPYNSPGGNNERMAFAYSDAMLKEFYAKLKEQGYFARGGTLLIVGDHRKMEPLEHEEFQKFGISANGRAVMTIVGPGIEPGSMSDALVQHSDIFSSLKYLYASGQVTLNSRFNDMLGKYAGRNQAIRYCQYVERQYIATDKANRSRTISAANDKQSASYIAAYKLFQNFTGSLDDESAELAQLKEQLGLTIIGHQGGAPMIEAPYSYAGMKRAHEQGADGIEFDVSTTKDGYNVVMHGPDIGRTRCSKRDGRENVIDFTLKELKDTCTLLNGEPILTVAEALQKTEGRFDHYFVDVKIYDPNQRKTQLQEIIQTIKKLDLEKKAIVSTYDVSGNKLLGTIADDYTIARDTFDPQDAKQLPDTDYAYFMLPYSSYTPELVQYVRSLEIEPVAYTLNSIQELQKLYEMGLRVIMTDNIPMVIDRMRSYKQKNSY